MPASLPGRTRVVVLAGGSSRGASVLDALGSRGVRVAADVVAATVAAAALPQGVAQGVRYPLCRWRDLPPRSVEEDASLAARASRLFHRWKTLCIAGSDVELPSDLDPTADA